MKNDYRSPFYEIILLHTAHWCLRPHLWSADLFLWEVPDSMERLQEDTLRSPSTSSSLHAAWDEKYISQTRDDLARLSYCRTRVIQINRGLLLVWKPFPSPKKSIFFPFLWYYPPLVWCIFRFNFPFYFVLYPLNLLPLKFFFVFLYSFFILYPLQIASVGILRGVEQLYFNLLLSRQKWIWDPTRLKYIYPAML
jgi:hypothetical protein